MTAVKPRDAERYLAAPPDGVRLFLVFGNDAGAVTERARTAERVALSRGGGDTVLRFGSDEISDNPGRLADEAYAASLFGGEPVIGLRVLDGRHKVLEPLKALLDRPPAAAWVVVEAGELAATSPLRRAFEDSPQAAAIATYQAEPDDLRALIGAAARESGFEIEAGALDSLCGMLGGDRLTSRRELEKLFTFVGAARTVSAADVAAIVGESAEVSGEDVIDAALIGDHEALDRGLERLRAEGGSAAALGSQALRALVQLQAMRGDVEAGAPAATALQRARPPIFSRRQAAVRNQLQRWAVADLEAARRRIDEAVRLTRYYPVLENAAISEALHRIALHSRTLARGGRS